MATPGTVACQAPLSLEFSRPEYWSGLLCPPPGALPDLGIEPVSLMSPALAGGFFTTSATWEAPFHLGIHNREFLNRVRWHLGFALKNSRKNKGNIFGEMNETRLVKGRWLLKNGLFIKVHWLLYFCVCLYIIKSFICFSWRGKLQSRNEE